MYKKIKIQEGVMNNLIKFENGKITCILTKAHNAFLFAKQFIENNKDKNLMLWQNRNMNHSPNSVVLTYGCSLKRLVDDDSDKFDVLFGI